MWRMLHWLTPAARDGCWELFSRTFTIAMSAIIDVLLFVTVLCPDFGWALKLPAFLNYHTSFAKASLVLWVWWAVVKSAATLQVCLDPTYKVMSVLSCLVSATSTFYLGKKKKIHGQCLYGDFRLTLYKGSLVFSLWWEKKIYMYMFILCQCNCFVMSVELLIIYTILMYCYNGWYWYIVLFTQS